MRYPATAPIPLVKAGFSTRPLLVISAFLLFQSCLGELVLSLNINPFSLSPGRRHTLHSYDPSNKSRNIGMIVRRTAAVPKRSDPTVQRPQDGVLTFK